ncbi:hypothetical protein JCM8097_002632 [Rhodosporidiobolus ruineniae]
MSATMAHERSPLLSQPKTSSSTSPPSPSAPDFPSSRASAKPASDGHDSPFRRLVVATLLLSTAFTFTASTLPFQVHEMLCDVWYSTHGDAAPPASDRCALPEIEAWTAKEVFRMATLTAVAGLCNLATTSFVTKRWGLRSAMVTQSGWPCLRLLIQACGILHGGLAGVRALQLSQLVTVLGGGPGYTLSANTLCAELVEPEEQTGSFGRLHAVQFLGSATGLIGEFLSVFASSYVPMLLHVTGINRFSFTPDVTGYLSTLASISRATFLSFLFPRIIAAGRRWYSPSPTISPAPSPPPEPVHIPTTAAEIAPLEPIQQTDQVVEPASIPPSTTETRGSHFDLVFLRLSILLDAVLTGFVPLSSQGWHLFLAAGIIPLASGTAPAAKGVVLEMVEKHEQADALQALALCELLAKMLTVSVSGELMAKLSEAGNGTAIFYVNSTA